MNVDLTWSMLYNLDYRHDFAQIGSGGYTIYCWCWRIFYISIIWFSQIELAYCDLFLLTFVRKHWKSNLQLMVFYYNASCIVICVYITYALRLSCLTRLKIMQCKECDMITWDVLKYIDCLDSISFPCYCEYKWLNTPHGPSTQSPMTSDNDLNEICHVISSYG